ncbi:MFS transporter [Dasania marina]|uniref:MFS transporter n=1 Tax=Dasania marina TaxID=471499 RepID=UPI0030DA8F60|tara:strand:+ start:101617 stop:102804 length:1188 start_codon:yes stop_codon:yes gene_type:complete
MTAYLGSKKTIIDINTTRSIIAVLFVSVAGACMFILQPVYVQGLVGYLHFSESDAGMITAAEMFGLAATAVVTNFIINLVNWRLLTLIFIALATAGNLLSIGVTDINLLIMARVLAGLGCGGLISITFIMMGLTQRSDRNIALLVVCVLTYGALGLFVMPSVFQYFGVDGVLIFFAAFCASCALFVAYLPCSHQMHEQVVAEVSSYSMPIKLLSLLGVLAYNLAIGIVWVYMFLVGTDAGIKEQTVANVLTASQVLGIAGALLVVVFERRFGRHLPLLAGIVGGAIAISLLLGKPEFLLFTIGVCAFNFLWNLSMPYIFAVLADFDARGKMVAVGISLQLVGFAFGPAIASAMLGDANYTLVNTIAIVLFIVSAILLFPGLRVQDKHYAATGKCN